MSQANIAALALAIFCAFMAGFVTGWRQYRGLLARTPIERYPEPEAAELVDTIEQRARRGQ